MEDKEPVLTHQHCPTCGANGCLSVWEDGKSYCHSCKSTSANVDIDPMVGTATVTHSTEYVKGVTPIKPVRNIAISTLKFYGVTEGYIRPTHGPSAAVHYFPYEQGFKTRNLDEKKFSSVDMKGKSGQLFGRDKFSQSGRYITLTEGEFDAMSLYQAFGSKYPVVSITASGNAGKACEDNYKWLDSFDNIVVAFDNDDPGQKAAKVVASKFSPGKVKIVKFNKYKDANEYLVNKEQEALKKAWWDAEPYSPSEIVNGRELISIVEENPIPECYDLPWEDLNKKTFGCRMQELWSIKAPPKVGKTSFLFELSKHLKDTTDFSIGTFFLEEPNKDSAIKFASLYADKRLFLPSVESTPAERRKAAEEAFSDGKMWFYDDFGGMDFEEIAGHIRFYVQALGCKFIIIDHISLLANHQKEDNERMAIDNMSHELKKLTIELDCCIFIVSHVNDEGKFRGSRALQQLSNMVIALDRDKTSPDENERNRMKVVVEESRFSGETGPVADLIYDKDTGRLEQCDPDELE